MKLHATDVVSLVFGLLFTMLATVFALHALDVVDVDFRVVPAVALILSGLGGIAAALATSARGTGVDGQRDPRRRSVRPIRSTRW